MSPLFMASALPSDSRPTGPGVDPELHVVAHLIHAEFDDHLDPHAVDECLSQVAARFDGAPIRSFVPLLVRRYAREELQQHSRCEPGLRPDPLSEAGRVVPAEGVQSLRAGVLEMVGTDPVQEVVGAHGVDQRDVPPLSAKVTWRAFRWSITLR